MAWLAFAIAALVLASPLKLVWARAALGWTFPFFLWLAVIVVGALVGAAAQDRHGDPDGDPHGDDER